MGACYLLAFPNGKVYVGITTKTVAERFREHCHTSRRQRHAHYPLYRALRKHGPASVTIHTLAESEDWPTLCLYERMFIAFYGSNRKGVGYNATEGGEGMMGLSEELRARINAASSERWQNPSYREKIGRNLLLGREHAGTASRIRWSNPVYRDRAIQYNREQKLRALEALAASVDDYGEYAGMGIAEPVDFEDRVRVAVQRSHLGYKQLARATAMSSRTVCYFATRIEYPSDATLRRLAVALGVPDEES